MKLSEKRHESSRTAQWVAAARTLGRLLPADLRLADDPYGCSFVEGGARRLAELCLRHPRLARRILARSGPLTSFLLWMQVRTRALDDVLLDFVRDGGRQVVLLGAGFDCRALRFGDLLSSATVFEVDHPATQARKIACLPVESMRARVVYVPWDFELDAMAELPEKLCQQGLDPRSPVLTIWEGVTMYLGEEAIDATVGAVHAFGADGSLLALTYIDRRALHRPDRELKLSARLVARVGEPWRFGFRPDELSGWLAARGFSLASNASDAELAARYLPARVWRHFAQKNRRIAVAAVRSAR